MLPAYFTFVLADIILHVKEMQKHADTVGGNMKSRYRINFRIKIIYLCTVFIFVSLFLILNYAFKHSRYLLIKQEAGVISQYMNRNELAFTELIDSIRKLSAASSTNKQVSVLLNQSCEGNIYSAENAGRIRSVEEVLTFYRNIFFDYRLHYLISGVDGTVYSMTDGIDNSAFFGQQFSANVREQNWYKDFFSGQEISLWVAPCTYSNKGIFKESRDSSKDEDFILFARRIKDYNSQKFLGVSFVSFPVENLSDILIPYTGASLALFNENNQLIYTNGDFSLFEDICGSNNDSLFSGHEGYFNYSKNGNRYLLNYVTVDSLNWRMINMVPLNLITESVDKLYNLVAIVMFLVALCAGFICFAMYIYINAPLNRLIHKVSSIRIGGIRISDIEKERRLLKPVYGITEAEKEISQMVDYIEELSTQTIKQKEIEQNLRYEMLRAQLNPHFLFNTLNVIKWSAMISGAENISDMITALGTLLESTMNRSGEESTLREEIQVAAAWVEIKNWAFKNKIQICDEIPETLKDFTVIRFFLQPLVENSVLHGIGNIENGRILIKAEYRDENVYVTITDNGEGIGPDELKEILQKLDGDQKRRHMTGIGLASIHELMKLKYGSDFGLSINSEKGKGTVVYAKFPSEKGMQYAESNNCR